MKKKKSFRKSYRKKPIISLYKKKWFWVAVLLPIILCFLVYLLLFSQVFWIDDIQLSGNNEIDKERVMNLFKEEISTDIFFLESRSIFLIDSSEIVSRILEEFPMISSIHIKRSFPNSFKATIYKRKAVAVWCRNDGECYLIDNEGVIFKEVSIPAGLVVIKGGNNNVSLSETPISSDIMTFLMEVWRDTKYAVRITEFEIEEPNIIAQTVEGWDIRFTLTDSPSTQVKKLILVLEKKISKKDRSILEYVDVRFENRVYFKRRDK